MRRKKTVFTFRPDLSQREKACGVLLGDEKVLREGGWGREVVVL